MSNTAKRLELQELEQEVRLLLAKRDSLLKKQNFVERSIQTKLEARKLIEEEISKLREDKIKVKEDFDRQQNHINRELRRISKVVDYRNELLNRVEMLSIEDDTLDKREDSQRNREKIIEVKNLEIHKQIIALEEQKNKALAVREAQSSSYYRPTETEEEFFLEKRGYFLFEYERSGNVAKSADATGIRPSLVNYYRKKYPEFAGDMQIAYDVFKDYLDGELIDRAVNGCDKPLFYRGEVVDHYTEKSDRLMEVAARAHIPEKYDRGKLDRIDGAKQTNVVVNMVSFKDAKSEDFGAVAQVGVVSYVGEHGEMKRVTNDRMANHELAIDPNETIIDAEVNDKQSRSVVFKDEDDE